MPIFKPIFGRSVPQHAHGRSSASRHARVANSASHPGAAPIRGPQRRLLHAAPPPARRRRRRRDCGVARVLCASADQKILHGLQPERGVPRLHGGGRREHGGCAGRARAGRARGRSTTFTSDVMPPRAAARAQPVARGDAVAAADARRVHGAHARAVVGAHRRAVRGLGVPDGSLDPLFGGAPHWQLKLARYPPVPPPADSVGVGAHTDSGFLTLLLQDDVGGLQVQPSDGRWVDVPRRRRRPRVQPRRGRRARERRLLESDAAPRARAAARASACPSSTTRGSRPSSARWRCPPSSSGSARRASAGATRRTS